MDVLAELERGDIELLTLDQKVLVWRPTKEGVLWYGVVQGIKGRRITVELNGEVVIFINEVPFRDEVEVESQEMVVMDRDLVYTTLDFEPTSSYGSKLFPKQEREESNFRSVVFGVSLVLIIVLIAFGILTGQISIW